MCTVNNRRTIKPVDPLLKSFNVPGMLNQKLYVQHTKELYHQRSSHQKAQEQPEEQCLEWHLCQSMEKKTPPQQQGILWQRKDKPGFS